MTIPEVTVPVWLTDLISVAKPKIRLPPFPSIQFLGCCYFLMSIYPVLTWNKSCLFAEWYQKIWILVGDLPKCTFVLRSNPYFSDYSGLKINKNWGHLELLKPQRTISKKEWSGQNIKTTAAEYQYCPSKAIESINCLSRAQRLVVHDSQQTSVDFAMGPLSASGGSLCLVLSAEVWLCDQWEYFLWSPEFQKVVYQCVWWRLNRLKVTSSILFVWLC